MKLLKSSLALLALGSALVSSNAMASGFSFSLGSSSSTVETLGKSVNYSGIEANLSYSSPLFPLKDSSLFYAGYGADLRATFQSANLSSLNIESLKNLKSHYRAYSIGPSATLMVDLPIAVYVKGGLGVEFNKISYKGLDGSDTTTAFYYSAGVGVGRPDGLSLYVGYRGSNSEVAGQSVHIGSVDVRFQLSF